MEVSYLEEYRNLVREYRDTVDPKAVDGNFAVFVALRELTKRIDAALPAKGKAG